MSSCNVETLTMERFWAKKVSRWIGLTTELSECSNPIVSWCYRSNEKRKETSGEKKSTVTRSDPEVAILRLMIFKQFSTKSLFLNGKQDRRDVTFQNNKVYLPV